MKVKRSNESTIYILNNQISKVIESIVDASEQFEPLFHSVDYIFYKLGHFKRIYENVNSFFEDVEKGLVKIYEGLSFFIKFYYGEYLSNIQKLESDSISIYLSPFKFSLSFRLGSYSKFYDEDFNDKEISNIVDKFSENLLVKIKEISFND